MKKEKLLQDINSLIKKGSEFNGTWTGMIEPGQLADCQYWFSRCGTIIQSVTGIDKHYYDQATAIISKSKNRGGLAWTAVQLMIGFLREFEDAIENGLIRKVENEITAKDFNDFLGHASEYLENGQKFEAAIICSALFEDSVKRVARRNNLETEGKLDSIINSLKSNNIISKVESQEFKYFSSIRNSSLHVNMEEISIDDVQKLFSGVSNIIKDYLAN